MLTTIQFVVGLFTAAVVATALPWQKSYHAPKPRPLVIAFGDSYMDNGNGSFRLTHSAWPADPAYWQGRFSNGPVWPDYFAHWMGADLLDLAHGGATIDNAIVQGYTGRHSHIPVPSVRDQVTSFLASQIPSSFDAASTLIIVDGGGNDLYFAGAHQDLADRTARSMLQQIGRLSQRGFRSFIVPSTPGLAASPYAREHLNDSQRADHATYATTFSTLLHSNWQRYVEKGTRVGLIDQHRILGGQHFRNSTHACLTGVYPNTDGEERQLCDDPDEHLYWDAFHPSTAAHRLLAQQARDQINVEGLL